MQCTCGLRGEECQPSLVAVVPAGRVLVCCVAHCARWYADVIQQTVACAGVAWPRFGVWIGCGLPCNVLRKSADWQRVWLALLMTLSLANPASFVSLRLCSSLAWLMAASVLGVCGSGVLGGVQVAA